MTEVTKTHDLGAGWYVNMLADGGMTLRNCDKGQRIDLSKDSADLLRSICSGSAAYRSRIRDRRIAIHQGWAGNVAAQPDWTGTIDSFWEKNQDLTWGDIRDMVEDLDAGDDHEIGGGARGCFTIRAA